MTRFARLTINNGENAWDAKANSMFQNLLDRPIPIPQHSGDESDLASTWAASSYDRCMIWVDHTVRGWTLYWSNGTTWIPFGGSINVRTDGSATVTVDPADNLVIVTGSGGNTVNLPPAASAANAVIHIKNNTTGTITIDADGTETIDGALTLASAIQYENYSLVSDGSNWHII